MIGQLWHRVCCHPVVRNAQSFGVMEISKSEKKSGHVDIAVPVIQIGEYNEGCGAALGIDLRPHADLASLFHNLNQHFPWADHQHLQLYRFQAGFGAVLQDEPCLEFESPQDDLLSQLCAYLQEHKSIVPRPLFDSYHLGHGTVTTVTKLEISLRESGNYDVDISKSETCPQSDGSFETCNRVTKKCVSRDKLLEACAGWMSGLRMALA
jgi:hypothetical protein